MFVLRRCMNCFLLWVGLSVLVVLVDGSAVPKPVPAPAGGPSNDRLLWLSSRRCLLPRVRREWDSLRTNEKTAFIRAVKCLMSSPSKHKGKAPGLVTRYEDFIWTHQQQTPYAHAVSHFSPWHRTLLYEFELTLRTECGYRDSLPYWDIKRTSPSNLLNSTIFSPLPSGFGGNGAYDPTALIQWLWIPAQGGGCIQSGPFKDVVIHIGPGNSTAYTERCIRRNIFPRAAERWMTKEEEERLYKFEEYEVFQDTLQGAIDFDKNLGVHNGGHLVVSGEMADVFTSPSEPLFWLHHANLDRIWATWQEQGAPGRLYEVNGPIAPKFNAFGWDDPPKGNITLDYMLGFEPVAKNRTIAEVIDTRGSSLWGQKKGILCYKYA